MILIKKEKYINIYKIFDFIVRQELSEFMLAELVGYEDDEARSQRALARG